MNDDAELLRRYAAEKSEAAFAELVGRHLGLVYRTALRLCGGDAHRAQDVAQLVFTDLARKAEALARRPVLAGWLYTSTRYAAAQAVRTEVRRQAREREAQGMNETPATGTAATADWDRLRPVLDDALHGLGERDREAVLLRFFAGCGFAEVGRRLAVSEDAARMRVERALEKMRTTLARHGVTSTAAALGMALAHEAGAVLPMGLATTVTGAALAGAGAVGGAGAWSGALLMNKLVAASGLLAVGGLTWFVAETRATNRLEAEVTVLRVNRTAWSATRQENRRLIAAVAATDTLAAERVALAELRRRAAELRTQVRPRSLDGRPMPGRREQLFERLRSPFGSYQVVLQARFADVAGAAPQAAAHYAEDVADAAEALCFDPAAQARLERFFTALPAETQARAGRPENLVARVFVAWRWQGDPPRRYGDPVKEIPLGDRDARVEVAVTTGSGRTTTDVFSFRRFDDGWRWGPLSLADTEALLALLDPATGEPRARETPPRRDGP